mmetsp:Transcript_58138/g.131738  ORF Transcript_58138/g.131738 Transcript_58138/m.131738 type:complete len:397 (-) Transcript_58138:142-1332(-)|eukprot:CAMPEP_0172640292 /NCGR_PEP_ID=MMETSP1068-20121228/222470_1 /TAXON_ID=35684 /ORGANISM="Pseudopedinella elastica, Strain CCMP716" /LENGTH=396 /DNA_ID=CAMNT_0013453647 /DNA_START=159 /DNA_END=1349 /DNA_ORIENTATION=-
MSSTPKAAASPAKASFVIKAALLVLLVVQNSLLNLCARWSRVLAAPPPGNSVPAQDGYAKATLVVVVELVKIVAAFGLLAYDRNLGVAEAWEHLRETTVSKPMEAIMLLVPGSLYVVQNNLVLVAAENLEGPVMAVLGQVKIITTAIFSVVLLRRSLHSRQWFGLVTLVVGVSVVQLSATTGGSAGDGGKRNLLLGVSASVFAATMSGFAGVFFEKVLKGSETSVWVRNVHLACFGVVVGLFGLFGQAGELQLVQRNGFLGGYNSVVWALVAVQAIGGLLVAAVVKYTDSILKAFATSVALVSVSVTSIAFFNFPLSTGFALGAALVVYATFCYGDLLPPKLLPPCLLPTVADACPSPAKISEVFNGSSEKVKAEAHREEAQPFLGDVAAEGGNLA